MPLREGVFLFEKEKDLYDKSADTFCAVVTGTVQERRYLEVPGTLGGLPVRKIAPHAFSDKKSLKVISFPQSLRSVGAFALHKCPQLQEISLHDGILDFHNGVVRQDSRLRRIRLTVHDHNYTVMRDILSDTDARLCFCLQLPDGEGRLLFPGYDYSFNENTMARTIQFSILGSGMFYRECVRRKGIGWREYDRLFDRVIPDDAHAAAEIAADRLLYPYDLSPVHAAAYEEYLRSHAREVLLQFTEDIAADHTAGGEEDAYRRLRLMADRGLIREETADPALRAAAARHMTEVCSIIMAGREAAFKDSCSVKKDERLILEEEDENFWGTDLEIRDVETEEKRPDFLPAHPENERVWEYAGGNTGRKEPVQAEENSRLKVSNEEGLPKHAGVHAGVPAGKKEPVQREGNDPEERNARQELKEEAGITGISTCGKGLYKSDISNPGDKSGLSNTGDKNNQIDKSPVLSLDDW